MSRTLYQIKKCPFAHRARIALNEKQLAYDVVYYEAKARPPELDALSPDAKSPTLFDGDERLWESLVVAEYVDERYPGTPLMPKDPVDRARVRLFLREIEAKVMPALGPVVMELVHKAGPPDDAKVREGLARFVDALAIWNTRLATSDFLVAGAFSLADVALYTPLVSMRGLTGEDLPPTLPALRAWRDRIAARPSTAY